MVDALDLWDRGAHFAAIRREWLALALPSGSALTVQLPDGVRRGRFQTIDGLGRLMIETDSGPLTVEAADVFLTAQGDPGAVQSR
jgi:BirA family biotin operon repressor/biotin-[acetyl-CoA-carboxylase] ligase